MAASLIVTAYWSGRTAHTEFSWLKRTEREGNKPHWSKERTKSAQVKLEASVSPCLVLSPSLSLISCLFHSPGEAQFFTQWQPAPLTIIQVSLKTVCRYITASFSSQHFLFHRWVQMDTKKTQTRQQELFYLWSSEQVFNFPPAKFISSIKRVSLPPRKVDFNRLNLQNSKVCNGSFLIKSVSN